MKKVLGIYSNPDPGMTVAGGILLEQFHSAAFTHSGRPFFMVQRVSKAPPSLRRTGW